MYIATIFSRNYVFKNLRRMEGTLRKIKKLQTIQILHYCCILFETRKEFRYRHKILLDNMVSYSKAINYHI